MISDLDSRILFWVLFAESSQPPSMSTRDGDCSGSQNISATPWRKTLAWSRVVATYQNTEITTIFLSIPLFLLSPSHFPLSFSLFLFLYFTEKERERGREGEGENKKKWTVIFIFSKDLCQPILDFKWFHFQSKMNHSKL